MKSKILGIISKNKKKNSKTIQKKSFSVGKTYKMLVKKILIIVFREWK